MTINKLSKIADIVQEILENDDLAKKDDNYLISKVIEEIYPEEINEPFIKVMSSLKSKGISCESITRARRKVQSKFPHLKDEETSKYRNQEIENYIGFSK